MCKMELQQQASGQNACRIQPRLTCEVAVTQSVWWLPHTTCVTSARLSMRMKRGLTQVTSARSPCPHCPWSLRPQVMTSSAVSATVCCGQHQTPK